MSRNERTRHSPRLSAGLLGLLFIVVLACEDTAVPALPPTATPTLDDTPKATAVPNRTGAAEPEGIESLPQGVRILSPAYHEAYRLLPNGPWARKYIARLLDDFDLEEWEQLEWNYGPWGEAPPKLTPEKEFFQLTPMLRAAERDPEVGKWLLKKVEALDPDAARRLQSAESISDRADVFRSLIEDDGREWDVEVILIEWGGKEAGQSDETISLIIEAARDHHEYLRVLGSLGMKERMVLHQEMEMCSLLMSTVAGENTTSVVTDGRCDIVKAIELAEQALQANGGRSALSEDDFRRAVEYFARQTPHRSE